MSFNEQIPFLYTIDGASSQVLTITNAKALSVLSSGGDTTIDNGDGQTMALPDGATLEIQADTGNTLTQIVITPVALAYVVMIGGNGVVTP